LSQVDNLPKISSLYAYTLKRLTSRLQYLLIKNFRAFLTPHWNVPLSFTVHTI
jgi:hypothetical protein